MENGYCFFSLSSSVYSEFLQQPNIAYHTIVNIPLQKQKNRRVFYALSIAKVNAGE